MLRRLSLFTILGFAPAFAAGLWPDLFAGYKRVSAGPIPLGDKPVWDEYGLEFTESARYQSPNGAFSADAFRLKDPTSALAVYQWLLPPGAKPSHLREVAHETGAGAHILLGNYVVRFQGRVPAIEEVQELFVLLPRVDQSSLPALPGFLPAQGLIEASPRYIIGPESLQKFEPRIPPSVALFSVSAEAQIGRFNTQDGEMNLAIFSYPTPHFARERLLEFQNLPGARARRSGPLVAVTFAAPSPDAAERLLAKVNYRANLVLDENPSKPAENVGDLLISIFGLLGVLLVITVLLGLLHAGARLAYRKYFGGPEEPDSMLTLHLGDK